MYTFADGKFRFFTAEYSKHYIVYRVREDSNPYKRAMEKGISCRMRIRKSTGMEILAWMYSHPTFQFV